MQTTLARETIGSNIAKFEMEATRKLPTGLTEIFWEKGIATMALKDSLAIERQGRFCRLLLKDE